MGGNDDQVWLTKVNSVNDRETPGYVASEYIMTILGALRHYDKPKRQTSLAMPTVWEATRLVTHVVCLDGAKVELDTELIEVGCCVVRRAPCLTAGYGRAGRADT